MRRVLKVIAVLRRHERLVVAAVLGLGVATMVAHWWGTARVPAPPAGARAPSGSRPPAREAEFLGAPRAAAADAGPAARE